MKSQPFDGLAISESLYGDVGSVKTKEKLANPDHTINLFGRPSLTPGVRYPISAKGERLLDAGYRHGYKDAMRMNRAGHLVEDDPFLDLLRKRVKEIRKEGIKKGRIEPATKQERKWRLGL